MLPSVFVRLWSAQIISVTGSQLSQFAIPLLAASSLGANEVQMGFLAAMPWLPYLCIGLPAGVWVDRLPPKMVMVAMDMTRAVLLFFMGSMFVWHWGQLEWLYGLTFLLGVGNVFFELAAQIMLPQVLPASQLLEGNRRLQSSETLAAFAGPGLAGVVVAWVSAALLVFVDAVSYLFSAFLVSALPHRQSQAKAKRSVWHELLEGLAFTWTQPILRVLTLCTALVNVGRGMMMAVFVLFVTRDLRLEPQILALIVASSGLGSFLGAYFSAWLTTRVGLAKMMIAAVFLVAFGGMLLPFAAQMKFIWLMVFSLLLGRFLSGFAAVVFNINQVSWRQRLTPLELLGRVTATARFSFWGLASLGSVLGGWLALTWRIVPTLWLSAGLIFVAMLVLWRFLPLEYKE